MILYIVYLPGGRYVNCPVHQASLETIKIKEQLIFELYPEDSVCNVQGVMIP